MPDTKSIVLREPTLEDGYAVFQLIGQCPPLDTNSSYCNLLQCSHFASTSVAAVIDDSIVGFISGYIIPDRPNTLFIWQVATGPQARRIGLASRMLNHILARPLCKQVTHLETSITEDNAASWALFERLANTLGADLTSSAWMDKQAHFNGQHASEALVRIGPFNANR